MGSTLVDGATYEGAPLAPPGGRGGGRKAAALQILPVVGPALGLALVGVRRRQDSRPSKDSTKILIGFTESTDTLVQ